MPTPLIDTINDARAVVGFVADHLRLIGALAERMPPDFEIDLTDLDELMGRLLIGGGGGIEGTPFRPVSGNPRWDECEFIMLDRDPTALSPPDLQKLVDRALECCAALGQVLGEPTPPPIE